MVNSLHYRNNELIKKFDLGFDFIYFSFINLTEFIVSIYNIPFIKLNIFKYISN